MAATRSGSTVIASTGSTTTSSAISVTADYAREVYIDLIQVGTATTAAQVQIQVSPDGGTNYYSPANLLWVAPLVAGTYDTVLSIPLSATHFKAVFTTQAGGTSSTVVVQLGEVTGV